jgi:cytochrome bd-type quinol oxidase subunit 2
MLRAMYRYWVVLHIVGVASFLLSHGVSMFALYRLRALDLDRGRIVDTITFSGATAKPMYASLVVLTVAGFVAGYQGKWLDDWWIWISIAVLIASTVLMTLIAKPYFKRISAACAMRPSGVPRTSDEELTELLGSSKVHLITAIGVGSLAIIIWLMVTKPGQTF